MVLNLSINIDENTRGYKEIKNICNKNNLNESDVLKYIVLDGLYAHIERNVEHYILTKEYTK